MWKSGIFVTICSYFRAIISSNRFSWKAEQQTPKHGKPVVFFRQKLLTKTKWLFSNVQVDKRKRLEEEALTKTLESEAGYRNCVTEANDRHRNLLQVKADVLKQVRELILQCDQTMKAVTVSYFSLQQKLTSPVPTQFQVCNLCFALQPSPEVQQPCIERGIFL